MQNEKYLELDALAAPNGYVAPPTKEDLAYVVHFRKTCQRYQIDFAKAENTTAIRTRLGWTQWCFSYFLCVFSTFTPCLAQSILDVKLENA